MGGNARDCLQNPGQYTYRLVAENRVGQKAKGERPVTMAGAAPEPMPTPEPTSIPEPTPAPTPVPEHTPAPEPALIPEPTAKSSVIGMPNSAAQFCVDQGSQWEEHTEGCAAVGYCVFPDGAVCEEWAYYQGNLGPVTALPPAGVIGLSNPASGFCTEKGHELECHSADCGDIGYCLFPGGSECEERAYYRGECQPRESSL